MNIVHPGDHIVLAFPAAYDSEESRVAMLARIKELADCSPSIVQSVSQTWMPIGSKGSEPYVLYVIRPR